jgi:hypothetical protein
MRCRAGTKALQDDLRWEHRDMKMNSKNVVAALRRDASFVWTAMIGVVFIVFAGLAIAATLLDLMALHR